MTPALFVSVSRRFSRARKSRAAAPTLCRSERSMDRNDNCPFEAGCACRSDASAESAFDWLRPAMYTCALWL